MAVNRLVLTKWNFFWQLFVEQWHNVIQKSKSLLLNIVDLYWFIEFNADFCSVFPLTGFAESQEFIESDIPKVKSLSSYYKVKRMKNWNNPSGDCEAPSRLLGGLMSLCAEIPGDAAMYSMIRVWSKPVQCPLQVSVHLYICTHWPRVPGASLHGLWQGRGRQAVHPPALSDGLMPQRRQRAAGQNYPPCCE